MTGETVNAGSLDYAARESIIPAKERTIIGYAGPDRLIIGKSDSMKRVLDLVKKVSDSSDPVLITGETGTGKELVARAIHYLGRNGKPFLAVNCSVPEDRWESDFFGHEKGAFTSAYDSKKGYFELAGDGTLLLDEINEMLGRYQPKLLRVLQENDFMRMAGEEILPSKARVISATSEDLGQLVEQKRFSQGLMYRLRTLTIDVPPLRERREDIPSLVAYYINQISNGRTIVMSEDAMKLLKDYPWPGNVRELGNAVVQAVTYLDIPHNINGNPVKIGKEYFSKLEQSLARNDRPKPTMHGEVNVRDYMKGKEKEYYTNLLSVHQGNIGQIAMAAGVDNKTVFRKLRVHGLDKQDFLSKNGSILSSIEDLMRIQREMD